LEFDVRVSSDGVPVINHDATLQRVHHRPERVEELSAATLGALGIDARGCVDRGPRPVHVSS
jgi:glycerophosphoryl diester phosphodiesterase